MPSLFEDSVAKGVMAKDSFIFGGAGDSVIAINVRVFAVGPQSLNQKRQNDQSLIYQPTD